MREPQCAGARTRNSAFVEACRRLRGHAGVRTHAPTRTHNNEDIRPLTGQQPQRVQLHSRACSDQMTWLVTQFAQTQPVLELCARDGRRQVTPAVAPELFLLSVRGATQVSVPPSPPILRTRIHKCARNAVRALADAASRELRRPKRSAGRDAALARTWRSASPDVATACGEDGRRRTRVDVKRSGSRQCEEGERERKQLDAQPTSRMGARAACAVSARLLIVGDGSLERGQPEEGLGERVRLGEVEQRAVQTDEERDLREGGMRGGGGPGTKRRGGTC
eukprot:6192659-Pleurochrysis_carterae.AAC.2